MNSIQIKICGMKHESNILDVSDLQPDMMGFIFYDQSPRFYTNLVLPEIAPGIKKIGVFVNADIDFIQDKINLYHLDGVQLHGKESADLCERLKKNKTLVIKAFALDETFDFNSLDAYQGKVDYFIFDTLFKNRSGGTGKKFDWNLLSKYHLTTPFLLSGGISPIDASAILEFNHLQFAGIDLNSGFEVKPGVKDLEKLTAFLNTIRA